MDGDSQAYIVAWWILVLFIGINMAHIYGPIIRKFLTTLPLARIMKRNTGTIGIDN